MSSDILSPAAAYSGSLDDFLINQQAMKHQELMDAITQQREQRVSENEKLELELKREELKQSQEEFGQRVHDKKIDTLHKYLAEQGPGDVPSPAMVKLGEEVGMPIRLGAAPTVATVPAGQSTVSLPGGGPPVPMPGAQPAQPLTDPNARPYLGSRADIARGQLATAMEGAGQDRSKIVPAALRLGFDPKDISSIMTADLGPTATFQDKENLRIKGTNKIPLWDPKRAIYMDPDTHETVPGSQIERVAPPRDPLVEALARETLKDKQKQNSEASADIKPGTPEFVMASDLAAGKLTYQDVIRSYAFQRTGREQARKIYQTARQMNPNLNPVSIQQELHAYSGELAGLQKQLGAVESYANSAQKNAQLLGTVLDKIPDTGFSGKPNDWIRQGNKILGSEDQVKFNLMMSSLQSEYSRLISNPNLTGVVTDSTRQEYRDILDKGGTIGQIKTLLKTLQSESENRRKGLEETVSGVKENIGDVAHAPDSAKPAQSKYKVTIKD